MIDDFVEYTAVLLAAAGALVLISSLLSRTGSRFGVPLNLIFLVVGMLAGVDGPGGVAFDRFDISYLVGTAALGVILFAGGLNTRLCGIRSVLAPVGVIGRWLMRRVPLSPSALFAAVSIAVALLAYGVPTLLGGSGFLAVYVAGIAMGNGHIPYALNLKRFHEAASWLAQIVMFL